MESTHTNELPVETGELEGFARLPSAEYHEIDRCSSHRLSMLRKSPAHLQHALANPETSDAMRVGEAVHCAILEPSQFKSRFAVAPKVDRRTTVGKETWAKFCLENSHKTVISQDDLNSITGIREAINSNETARLLISSVGDVEVCGFWTDEATGLKCKMRIDARCQTLGALLDLKTTVCASRREFERAIFNYGYHRQAAFYLDGCKALGEFYEDYTIIAVEKEAPFALAVYRLKDDVIELGRKENAALMQLYATCERSGNWPGYPDLVQDIGLPAWAKRQIEEDNAL